MESYGQWGFKFCKNEINLMERSCCHRRLCGLDPRVSSGEAIMLPFLVIAGLTRNPLLCDITELDSEYHFNVDREILATAKAIKRIFSPNLINLASLGNHVQHLHWHIIPRYKNESTWGNPPWPHERIIISEEQQLSLANEIREKLLSDCDFKKLPSVTSCF